MGWRLALILIIVAEATLTSVIPLSRGYFYDLIQAYSPLVYVGLGVLFLNALGLETMQAVKNYVVKVTSLMARETKTKEIVKRKKEMARVKNIDQRIQEDIRETYKNRIFVFTEYAISSLILIGLIATNIHDWKLVLGALVYAVITISIAYMFNPKMKQSEKGIQITEANFRLKLNRTISLMGFKAAQDANYFANRVRTAYLLFTKTQSSILIILPYLVLLPSYIAKVITLGDLVQASTVFSLIVVNANILVAIFPVLTAGNASKERMEELGLDKTD